jgi:hypothetical protein
MGERVLLIFPKAGHELREESNSLLKEVENNKENKNRRKQ